MAGSAIYHFERELRDGEWSAIGSGEGGGEGSPQRALDDLRRLSGGDLPPGRYRYLLAFDPADVRWGYLDLSEEGSITRL